LLCRFKISVFGVSSKNSKRNRFVLLVSEYGQERIGRTCYRHNYFIFFVFFLIFAINNQFNETGEILWGLALFFGAAGIGCMWKPKTVGAYVKGFFDAVGKAYGGEGSGSNIRQTQRDSNGVQVVGDRAQVYNLPRTENLSEDASVFSCPNGHPITVYPPDHNHPIASLERDVAEEDAIDTVITRRYKCEVCGRELKLYWYDEESD
jgi:hypothetical protein